jgi:hypothetical protein
MEMDFCEVSPSSLSTNAAVQSELVLGHADDLLASFCTSNQEGEHASA